MIWFRSLVAACIFSVSLASAVIAQQFDASFYEFQERLGEDWPAEDAEIDARLAALREGFGTPPNIIYILADDVGWNELGTYLGGRLRGTPSPTLDRMAEEGIQFLQHYAEPSCTPTRLAIMTGRHPVRTGCLAVLWPGQTEGLDPEEITIAEVLSEAGYDTAMWGKWHVGDLEEHAPENQGFDYAYYGLYNGAAFGWADQWNFYQGEMVSGNPNWPDMPSFERYEELTGIEIHGMMRGRRGEGREEVRSITSSLVMEEFEDECLEEIIDYVEDHEGSDRPFFIYWATYCQQLASSPRDYRFGEGVDYANNQAAQMGQHNAHLERLLATLQETGLEENTLLVWVSDNGPMYAFFPNAGYSLLRGGKGDIYEGGIRTPGIARWPGMIEPGQQVVDFIHVTDLFTTAARLAGVLDELPEDRVIDGVDQTALLLLGDGHSRRQIMYHYSGGSLGAVRWGPYKMVVTEGHGGLPGMEVYNIMRDPAERFGQMYNYLHMVTPFQQVIQAHMQMIAQFPHRTLQPQHDMAPEAELTPHD